MPSDCLFQSLWCQAPDTYGFLLRFGLQNRQPESLVRYQKITGVVKLAHQPAERFGRSNVFLYPTSNVAL